MRFLAVLLVLLAFPSSAFAYIGPGAGLSLLGALWALLAAVGLAIAFVVAWPIRKMMRRRNGPAPENQDKTATQPDTTFPDPQQASRKS